MSAVKIRSLIDLLNKANKAYYYGESEMMSNKEYDDLYDQLKRLEDESGIIYSDSPTQNLGDYVYSSLPKLKHESPMLSLDKTKDREVLKKWLWNMIIPQVLSNKTRSDNLIIPDECPTCGAATEIVTLNGTQTLRCTNLDCPAKFLNKLIHFCSRDAMDIQGLSKKTLEFLIDKGWVSSLIDLYSLQAKEVQWSMIRGYSTVSVRKILAAIESSKHTESNRFLYALGIPKIGKHQSKALIQVYGSWNNFVDHREEDFSQIPGIGDCLNDNIHKWFNDLYEQEHIKELSEMMIFEDMDVSAKGKFEGKTFCITGKLSRNRSELVDYIEKNGGHVSGSVSKNTDYLINNDKGSSSSKNRKAIELGISIITENDFDSL